MSSPLPRGATILFISAMPSDEGAIDFTGEYRAIDEAVRGHFKLSAKLAARPEDLVSALTQYKPQVLHFSGHGTGKGGLAFEDDQRAMVLLEQQALDSVFAARELVASLQLVVLNACWSEEQARTVASNGPDIVGMKIDVLDEVAKAFADGFYRSLAAGMTIEGAHAAAISWTAAKGLPEADSPVLVLGKKQPGGTPSSDRGALRRTVDRLYPGNELKKMIFEFFPEFSDEVSGLQLQRWDLLMQFLQWVLERAKQRKRLEELVQKKQLEEEQ